MKRRLIKLASVFAASIPALGPFPALAQEPRPVANVFELSFMDTSGNSKTRAGRVADRLTLSPGRGFSAALDGSAYRSTAGTFVTAEWYTADLRLDQRVAGRLFVYGIGGWERNIFGGIVRRLHGDGGLGFHLLQTKRHYFSIEGGVSYTGERRTDRTVFESGQGRGAATYRLNLTETASITETFNSFYTFRDSGDPRHRSDTAADIRVSRHVNMRVAYTYMYRGRPVPGFRKEDRIFSTGVTVSF